MSDPFEHEPHVLRPLKGINGVCCQYCGLVRGQNYLTQFALKHGCNWSDHPQAAHAMRTLPRAWQERYLTNAKL